MARYLRALDIALTDGSRADPVARALLKTATRKQARQIFPPGEPNYGPRPSTSSPSGNFTLPTKFSAGANITPEQADVPCRKLNEEVLSQSLALLVGLNKSQTQLYNSWILNDVRYFIACDLDFGLAYAIARVVWE